MSDARDTAEEPTAGAADAQKSLGRALSLRRVPFRARLTLGFAGVMIVLFGGLALLLHERFAASLDQGLDRSLHTHAADLATLVRGGSALPALPEAGDTFAQIIDPRTGRARDATPGHVAPLLNRAQLRLAATSSLTINMGDDARLRAQSVDTKPPAVLVVGSSLSQRNRALTTLSELLFIGGPLMLILTCVAGYGLAARALAPVERMSVRAARISGAPTGERLPIPEADDELHRLGVTINAMLSRVEDALARERSFVADAGHELRTPLTILKLELDLALSGHRPREELEARLHSVADEVDRLAKLAEDLLVIARAEQGRLPLERHDIDARSLLATVAARFETAAHSTRRAIRVDGRHGLAVEADRARLEQALTNIISNALRYASGDITLRAQGDDANVQLHVLDEGSGFEPEFLPHAFERFSQRDAARSGRGAGLGLSIVRVIAEAHGGNAHLSNRMTGGADVWLELPGIAAVSPQTGLSGAESSTPLPTEPAGAQNTS